MINGYGPKTLRDISEKNKKRLDESEEIIDFQIQHFYGEAVGVYTLQEAISEAQNLGLRIGNIEQNLQKDREATIQQDNEEKNWLDEELSNFAKEIARMKRLLEESS